MVCNDLARGAYKDYDYVKKLNVTYVENGTSTVEHYSPYATVYLKNSVQSWNKKANGTGTSYLATETLSTPGKYHIIC